MLRGDNRFFLSGEPDVSFGISMSSVLTLWLTGELSMIVKSARQDYLESSICMLELMAEEE